MIAEYVEVRKEFGEFSGTPSGNEFWVILNQGVVESVTFLCPCGCGRECYTPVTPKGTPKTERHWMFSRDKASGKVTLSPSIRYIGGCKAHFNITDGKSVMHGDSGK